MTRNRHTDADASERAVLGAVMLDAASIGRAMDAGLTADDFGTPSLRIVWDAVVAIEAEGAAPDVVTLSSALAAAGRLDMVGGFSALSSLASAVPSVLNLPAYVAQVKAASLRRKLLQVAGTIAELAADGDTEPATALDRAVAAVDAIACAGGVTAKTLRHIGEIVTSLQDDLETRQRMGGGMSGFSTGLVDLDFKIGGLRRQEYSVWAGRPSSGKSALLRQIIKHAGARQRLRCLLFDIEMPGEKTAARMISDEGGISATRIRDATMRTDDWAPFYRSADLLSGTEIWVDDGPRPTGAEIRSRVRRFAKTHGGVDLVSVDYLQLVRGEGDAEHERTAHASMAINDLKKEFDCHVAVAAQLNRDCEKRTDKRPIMSDLAGSGQIEKDADVIVFLYRPEMYDKSPGLQGKAEAKAYKVRHGTPGTVDLHWRGDLTRFENAERTPWNR